MESVLTTDLHTDLNDSNLLSFQSLMGFVLLIDYDLILGELKVIKFPISDGICPVS